MKKICTWHPIYFGRALVMGKVAPLSDKRVTHGMCARCAERIDKEVDEWLKGRPKI